MSEAPGKHREDGGPRRALPGWASARGSPRDGPPLRTREAGRQPGSRPWFPRFTSNRQPDNRLSPLAPSLCPGQKLCFRSLAERSSPHSRTQALSGFPSVLGANKNGGREPWRRRRPGQHPSVWLAFSSPPPLFLGRGPHNALPHSKTRTC